MTLKFSINEIRNIIQEIIEEDLEEQIEELMSTPEFKTPCSFVEYKLDNDDYEFNFVELQALARNATKKLKSNLPISQASSAEIAKIRKYLEDEMGFKFIGRKPVKSVRGVTSNPHGRHPMAGMGGGGSGFGSDFTGTSFTSFGGGPGAIGGGYKWSANDPKNLGMSAKKK